MSKKFFDVLKKIPCLILSAGVVAQGFMPVWASTSGGFDEKKTQPPTCCAPPSRVDVLMENLNSEESRRIIGTIFRDVSDFDQIVAKATSSPAHKGLLRIGFEVCTEWDATPTERKTMVLVTEKSLVCELIKIFWGSNSIVSIPREPYQRSGAVGFFSSCILDKRETLNHRSLIAYHDHVLFRLRVLEEICLRARSDDDVWLRRKLGTGTELYNGEDVARACAFCCCAMVACLDQGGCHHLAECVWRLFSGVEPFRGISKCGSCIPFKYSVNDVANWLGVLEADDTCFCVCKDFLMKSDKKFDPPPGGVLLCTPAYTSFLEETALNKRVSSFGAEKRAAKRKEKAEAMKRKREAKLEKGRQQQERREHRKAEEEKRRKIEAEAKQKAEEEAKRMAEEETRRKAEEEAKRAAEEDAKREAEKKRKKEEEERIKAERIRSGVADVIEANRRIRESGANEPKRRGDCRKF